MLYLDISLNFITDDAARMLGEFFRNAHVIKKLNVSQCKWQENGLSHLLDVLVNTCDLRYFNCSLCKINDDQAKILAKSSATNKTIEHLILANCAITPTGLVGIAVALKEVFTLKHLDLAGNQFSEEVITILAEIILML